MALGDFLRDERARRGQNYREFAELCGISVSALRWIEDHPESDPGLSVVMGMADGLKIPRWRMLEHAGYPSGRDQRPPLSAEELDQVIEAAIDQMNEDVQRPARSAKETLAALLRLPRSRRST